MKTDKKASVINAALQLFGNTHNIKKVSLEDIAAAAGVSPTTIYNIFGTRENLIVEIIKILSLKNLAKNKKMIESDLPFPQKLAAIIGSKQDLMDKYDAEIIEKIVSQDESIKPFVDRIYDSEIKPLWLKMMSDGQKEGYIDEALNLESLLLYLDIMKAGLNARQDLMVNFTKNPGQVMEITRLMFHGFLKKDLPLFKKEANQA
jgi:AcrR family transcriptional regulator